jgi:hypothetical protein
MGISREEGGPQPINSSLLVGLRLARVGSLVALILEVLIT